MMLFAGSGARKAVVTDTAFVHTARYARASRAIALESVKTHDDDGLAERQNRLNSAAGLRSP